MAHKYTEAAEAYEKALEVRGKGRGTCWDAVKTFTLGMRWEAAVYGAANLDTAC